MLAWLTQNLATILIGAIVLIICVLIIAHMIKNKKKGKSSCGCGCADCAMKNSCHPKQ